MDFAVSSLATRGYIPELVPSGSIHLDAAVMDKTSHRSLVVSNPRRADDIQRRCVLRGKSAPRIESKGGAARIWHKPILRSAAA